MIQSHDSLLIVDRDTTKSIVNTHTSWKMIALDDPREEKRTFAIHKNSYVILIFITRVMCMQKTIF